MATKCAWCGKEIKNRDEIGINRKLLGTSTHLFYCLPCFALYLDCTENDLYEKIKQFKEEGCILFQ
jgi:hypothetical protein